MNLFEFISKDWPLNAWIREPCISIYVRKGTHLIGNEMLQCLDIGSVEVDEDKQNKGIFTAFLKRFEQEAKRLNWAVYIESIQTPRFRDYLLSLGYSFVPGTSELCPSVFKFPT